jgi:hypothetical protein
MKLRGSLVLGAFALSLGVAAFTVEASPLTGAPGSSEGRHLRHDVVDKSSKVKQCWCVNPGGNRCWFRCCREGGVSRCYRTCYPSMKSCGYRPAAGISPGK